MKPDALAYRERIGADIERGGYSGPSERRLGVRDRSDIWWETMP